MGSKEEIKHGIKGHPAISDLYVVPITYNFDKLRSMYKLGLTDR